MIEKKGGTQSAPEYGIDWDSQDELDLENRLTETGYTPEDREVENPCAPGRLQNISGRKRPRRT